MYFGVCGNFFKESCYSARQVSGVSRFSIRLFAPADTRRSLGRFSLARERGRVRVDLGQKSRFQIGPLTSILSPLARGEVADPHTAAKPEERSKAPKRASRGRP